MKDHVDEKADSEFIENLLKQIDEYYWRPLSDIIKNNSTLQNTFTGFLISPKQLIISLGKEHVSIEYVGNEKFSSKNHSSNIEVIFNDYSEVDANLFELIVGFKFTSTAIKSNFPLPPFIEDLVLPTNSAADKLVELGWKFFSENAFFEINSSGYYIPTGEHCRLINGRFYDTDTHGLKTRHIQWIDFIPLSIVGDNEDSRDMIVHLGELVNAIEFDANYQYPAPKRDDYVNFKLPIINRFIELIGSSNTSETEITGFLSKNENKFILTMGTTSTSILHEEECPWQTADRDPIKPDFFIVRANGYVDILEFKLPYLKSNTIVGRHNREAFSAELNSYIAQTRVYREYFEDPSNRIWFENKFSLKVRYPKRILVVGRRWDFPSHEWKEIIEDYKDIEIINYNDLIDTVVAQFYM